MEITSEMHEGYKQLKAMYPSELYPPMDPGQVNAVADFISVNHPTEYNYMELVSQFGDHELVGSIAVAALQKTIPEQHLNTNSSTENILATMEAALATIQSHFIEIKGLYQDLVKAVSVLDDIEGSNEVPKTRRLMGYRSLPSIGPADPADFRQWFIDNVAKGNDSMQWVIHKDVSLWSNATFRKNLIESAQQLGLLSSI